MTIANSELKRGDCLRIGFGGGGSTQLAVVHKVTPSGNVHVWKFSASRAVWKGPIRLFKTEALNREKPGALMNAARCKTDYADPAKEAAFRELMHSIGL